MCEIVDSVGYGNGQSVLSEIMRIDLNRLLAPGTTFVVERTNHLFVLGIDTDHGATTFQKELLDSLDVAKLLVTVWVRWATQTLTIGNQPDLVFLEEPSHCCALDDPDGLTDSFFQPTQTAPHPASGGGWLTSQLILDLGQQGFFDYWTFFSTVLRPPPTTRTRSVGRSTSFRASSSRPL